MVSSKFWKYTGLSIFQLSSICVFFMVGLLSKRNSILQKKSILSLIFMANIMVPQFVFQIPFIGTTIINLLGFGAFYLGIKFRVIGLTGGIASGKSTVSKILKENGFKIIDADTISHNMRKYDRNY